MHIVVGGKHDRTSNNQHAASQGANNVTRSPVVLAHASSFSLYERLAMKASPTEVLLTFRAVREPRQARMGPSLLSILERPSRSRAARDGRHLRMLRAAGCSIVLPRRDRHVSLLSSA